MSIQVDHLSKMYGSQRAVDNISFRVETGEILGFLGPNGAGKTTTMKIITCYLAPSMGEVLVDGISIKDNPDQVKKKIGYLPEHNPLYLDMAIIDYLHFTAAIQGVEKSAINNAVRKMVDVCGLDREKHKKIGELSKGFRQRVGLAQALIHDPDILILDEPTTGLDPNQIIEIRNLIKSIGQSKTVLFSTHTLSEVELTCDRMIIINKGAIVVEGKPSDIRRQQQGKDLVVVTIEDGTNINEIYAGLKQLPNVSMVEIMDKGKGRFQIESNSNSNTKRDIFQYCVSKNLVITEMTNIETRLEDIFKSVTK